MYPCSVLLFLNFEAKTLKIQVLQLSILVKKESEKEIIPGLKINQEKRLKKNSIRSKN
jgi:hypothetical protein